MGRFGTLAVSAAALTVLTTGARAEPAPSHAYAYPPPGRHGYFALPEFIDRAGKILQAISSPQRRSDLAEDWLKFAKQTIVSDQQWRERWLEIERQRLRYCQQLEPLRLEIARLQMRVEELRAENLRLEQENLLAQLQLVHKTGEPDANEPPPRRPLR